MTQNPSLASSFEPGRAARRVGAIWLQEFPTLLRLGALPGLLIVIGMTLVLQGGVGSPLALGGGLLECAGLALYAARVYRLVVLGEGMRARRAAALTGAELRLFLLLAGMPALGAVLFLVIVTSLLAVSGIPEGPIAVELSVAEGFAVLGGALALLIVLVRLAEFFALFLVDTAVTSRFRPVRMWRLSGRRVLGFFCFNALVGAGLVAATGVAIALGFGLEALVPPAEARGLFGDTALKAGRLAMGLLPLSLGLVASSVGYTEMVRAADEDNL